MQLLAALFLALLGAGCLAMLLRADRAGLGDGYFKLVGCVFGVALAAGAGLVCMHEGENLVRGTWHPLLVLAGVLAVVHALALLSGKHRLERGARLAAIGAAWAGATLLAATLFEKPGLAELGPLAAALVSTSLLLGSALTTMLCGHWYLIDRRLDFAILHAATRTLGWLLLLKTSVVVWQVVRLGGTEPMLQAALLTPAGLLGCAALLRVGVGLLGPCLVVYMALDCVARRSNQSATGLLYVLDCLVLTGEATALVIAAMTGTYL